MSALPDHPIPPEKDFRSAFQGAAEKYRKRSSLASLISKKVFPVAMGFLVLGVFPSSVRTIAIAGFLVCGGILVVGGLGIPKLVCPACNKNPGKSLGDYCPECGAKGVTVLRFPSFSAPKCESCGRKLTSGSGRLRYKICYCTHCGACLDSGGL